MTAKANQTATTKAKYVAPSVQKVMHHSETRSGAFNSGEGSSGMGPTFVS
ncbi:MAG: hypothetical protein KDE55_00965 [Novosphingobium sp.]|nr:hypothetical protein [Novosphingobium sp.]